MQNFPRLGVIHSTAIVLASILPRPSSAIRVMLDIDVDEHYSCAS